MCLFFAAFFNLMDFFFGGGGGLVPLSRISKVFPAPLDISTEISRLFLKSALTFLCNA